MARGDKAKQAIISKLAEAFGDDWIGEVNKKYYVWANDGGERVQISVALACPKTLVGDDAAAPTTYVGNGLDFEAMSEASAPTPAAAAFTEKETANIEELMRRLNL